ncbi:hypothetical protein L7F22_046367 [Adiantum nelumboides]|nr:hypothetical protein [Adiantum nelumboides]
MGCTSPLPVGRRGTMKIATLFLSILLPLASAFPLFEPSYHPIVVWHGLGDSAYAEGMQEFAKELREAFPGIYVHVVALGQDATSDQRAGFFGNVNDQASTVCTDLSAVPELANGFDAVGFSQGGQFLRAYVERCNAPQVRNLITFGSQHQGISDLPACKPGDFFCRLAEGALRGGIYTDYAQSNLVTAQYYRDSKSQENYQRYLEANYFLTDINNEKKEGRNATYKANLEKLDNFVMLMFDKDTTVEPKQSSWFATYPVPSEDKQGAAQDKLEVLPLRQSEIYLEDRIGLKALDKRGAIKMEREFSTLEKVLASC